MFSSKSRDLEFSRENSRDLEFALKNSRSFELCSSKLLLYAFSSLISSALILLSKKVDVEAADEERGACDREEWEVGKGKVDLSLSLSTTSRCARIKWFRKLVVLPVVFTTLWHNLHFALDPPSCLIKYFQALDFPYLNILLNVLCLYLQVNVIFIKKQMMIVICH